ncbi:MAG: serine hydrolase domain-containing protein [Sporichthyaceae bacterium]
MNTGKRIAALATAAATGLSLVALPGGSAQADTGELPALPLARTFAGDDAACAMTRTAEYPVSSPEAVGLDSAKLKAAVDYWTSENSETVKVFRNGCLVAESGRDPLLERIPRQNWSQTKTVNALVAGVAVRQGLIKVDAPIGDYLPEGLGDAAHRAIKVRHVLNMTTGLDMNWVRGLNFFGDISRPREAMAAPLVNTPGQYFWYDQTTPSLLTYVVQRALIKQRGGQDYQDFAQKEFFNKLGIPASAYWWQRDRSGNTLGYSQLFLRPLEFGRLGEVMRNNGVFQGERLIDSSYMKQLRVGSKANCGNGFMVWLNRCKAGEKQFDANLFARKQVEKPGAWITSAPSDMYLSFGYHGQHTFVIPSLGMVITRTGETAPDTVQNLPNDGAMGSQIGAPFGQGYFNFFTKLMSGVTNMTAAQKSLISNKDGVFDTEAPTLNVDWETFDPSVEGPGSYLALGSAAPTGCTVAGCEGETNGGNVRWMSDVPRTFAGIAPAQVGTARIESRPNG